MAMLHMKSDEIKENIKRVIENARSLTLQLVRLSKNRKNIKGRASGFLVDVGGSPYLISAGHVFKKKEWVIETPFVNEEACVSASIPIGGVWTLKRGILGDSKLRNVEVAWAKIDFPSFQKAVTADPKIKKQRFEYLLYHGPTEDDPDPKTFHTYSAWNLATLVTEYGRAYLHREFTFEYEMVFKRKRADGLYVFSIPKHKGHSYYRGASGSPIIEPYGKIIAVFVRGNPKKNELYGYPMKGLIALIKSFEEADKRRAAGNTP